jgi:hypothetical protein
MCTGIFSFLLISKKPLSINFRIERLLPLPSWPSTNGIFSLSPPKSRYKVGEEMP